MNSLIENLRRLNSKERFFVIGQALGNRNFAIGDEFRESLEKSIQVKIPRDAFAAIDYHLDWIYASLVLSHPHSSGKPFCNKEGAVAGQQEDVDLMIAFRGDDSYHLVFIEAKGVTNWSHGQANSKVNRLRTIFGEDGNKWPEVVPHFLLMSPKPPIEKFGELWPEWMCPNKKPHFIELYVPNDLKAVSRCDEAGRASSVGGYWKLRSRNGG